MDTNMKPSTSAKESEGFEFFEDSDDSVRDPDFILSDEEPGQTRYLLFREEEDDEEGKVSQMAVNSETHVPDNASATVSAVSEENMQRQHTANRISNLHENKILTRERKRKPDTWKMNINKKLCQRGKEHKDVKGQIQKGKKLKSLKNCETGCKYLCNRKKSSEDRERIFKGFWELSNDAKWHFYAKNTERIDKARKQTLKAESRRKYTYKYYFHVDDVKIRVCKVFFLSTLDISQQRINYFHEKKKDEVTGIPEESRQRCHSKKVISDTRKDFVRLHIKQLSRVESHYCRVDTKKEYLEGTLNMTKLYSLYTEFCSERQIEPVKKNIYTHIFNYEFNIDFLKPKKDRCDVCEEYRLKEKSGIADEEKVIWENHSQGKIFAKVERDLDRSSQDEQTAIICFDLGNVFALPRSNISCFFYSRKLNTYNLTAHCINNSRKQAYCCIWSEGTHGRQGSDIASGLIKILERVIFHFPHIKRVILWSDSCVPQNKNSIMSLALLKFLKDHPTLEEIIQKFGEPGHSSIQEVDNLHSQIEKKLSGVEIFSPLGLLRLLPAVNQKKPFVVFHMKHQDFKLYKEASKSRNFKKVPYASLRQLKFVSMQPNKIYYKLRHNNESFTEVSILPLSNTRQKNNLSASKCSLPEVRSAPEPKTCLLPFEKVTALMKLFKFMPPVDVTFMKTLFKQYNDPSIVKKEKNKINKTNE